MPSTSTIQRTWYPEKGWASFFGSGSDISTPWAFPYAFFIYARGSSGVFSQMNTGMWFRVDDSFTYNFPVYTGAQKFAGSSTFPTCQMNPGAPSQVQMIWDWYFTTTPLAFYQGNNLGTWSNCRNPVLLANNAVWIPPLFPSVIGPNMTLRPFNRGAYEKYV